MNPNDKKTTDSTTQTIEQTVEETTPDEAGKVAGGSSFGTRHLVEEGEITPPTDDGQLVNV